MKIIFAQGNPGKEYKNTRHNVGFFLVDEIAKKYGATFASKPKFHADIAEFTADGEKILLAKPTTFYNETGASARALVAFYKCDPATDFLVIHDELALPFGVIRTREKGSDAGNNGIKSLNAHLGLTYLRIRVGVYNELRDHKNDADFVLGKFSADEKAALPKISQAVENIADGFIRGMFEPTKITVIT
jgi:PTH1 family peptidyl-tRNA hydrolase